MAARLEEHYDKVVVPNLLKQFGYANKHQIPRLKKIVVNMGIGEAIADSKKLDAALSEMTAITGQKPLVIKAKKSVANFKLRQGMRIGCKVTLRGDRMYEFLDRLINLALPQVRDFRGTRPKAKKAAAAGLPGKRVVGRIQRGAVSPDLVDSLEADF